MTLPVYELAVQEIATRLASCTEANGYTFNVIQVVRTTAAPADYQPGTVEVLIVGLDPQQEEAAPANLVEYLLELQILLVVEQSAHAANDTAVAQAVRDLVHVMDLADGAGLWLWGRTGRIDHVKSDAGERAAGLITVGLLVRSEARALDQGP